jgi:hypothetical protein
VCARLDPVQQREQQHSDRLTLTQCGSRNHTVSFVPLKRRLASYKCANRYPDCKATGRLSNILSPNGSCTCNVNL